MQCNVRNLMLKRNFNYQQANKQKCKKMQCTNNVHVCSQALTLRTTLHLLCVVTLQASMNFADWHGTSTNWLVVPDRKGERRLGEFDVDCKWGGRIVSRKLRHTAAPANLAFGHCCKWSYDTSASQLFVQHGAISFMSAVHEQQFLDLEGSQRATTVVVGVVVTLFKKCLRLC